MLGSGRVIYVCTQCLRISPNEATCHNEAMIECDCGLPGDERSRPVMTAQGKLVTHAPRWWVETCRARAKMKNK